jgi:hypothetical protein
MIVIRSDIGAAVPGGDAEEALAPPANILTEPATDAKADSCLAARAKGTADQVDAPNGAFLTSRRIRCDTRFL